MTAVRALLARANERLDETDTGTVLVAVVAFLAAVTAALIWGPGRVIDVILAAGVAAVAWYAAAVRARADRASDEADKALATAQAAGEDARLAHDGIADVMQHLAADDAAPAGRHASRATSPTPFPRRPTPVELP